MEQVNDFISTVNNYQDKYGYALWATQLKETGKIIGFIGLNYIDWEAPFTPAVEIGWRLGLQYWGKSYATEGTEAALDFGFNKILMEKIGMKRDFNGDFVHQKLPMGSYALATCVI